jgi:hypothetical protein
MSPTHVASVLSLVLAVTTCQACAQDAAPDVTAQLRSRAASGDKEAILELDALLGKQARAGSDPAVTELLSRAKAGDRDAETQPTPLRAYAESGSTVAMAELRRLADNTRATVFNHSMAQTSLVWALSHRAAEGDTGALAELRTRAVTDAIDDSNDLTNAKQALAAALGHLAAGGDATSLAELHRLAKSGDGNSQYELETEYLFGTQAVKRDVSMAAHVRGCPVPDETIMASCRSVPYDMLPKQVIRLMTRLKCDADPMPAALNLNGPETPAYKISCIEPADGAPNAFLIAKIRGRWKRIADMSGDDPQCSRFYPLMTVHAGFHDICEDGGCSPVTTGDHGTECQAPILEFNGDEYRYRYPWKKFSR